MSPIRGLTASEKQRLYVDASDEESATRVLARQIAGGKYVGARVLECPQNSTEERKLARELARIEHARQKKAAQLTTQKHTLRMDHKNFLGPDYLMPGFRYHKNGDIKVPKYMRDVIPVKPVPLSKRSNSAPTLQTRPKSKTNTSQNRVMLNEQIDALKRELRHIKSNQQLLTRAKSNTVKSNKAYIRAHTNDSPFNRPGTPTTSPRRKEEDAKIDVSAERFSRRSSRPNCVACECTLHKTDALEATERKKVPELKLKWKSPPKGFFLKSLSAAPLFAPASPENKDKVTSDDKLTSSTALQKKPRIPLTKALSGPPNSPASPNEILPSPEVPIPDIPDTPTSEVPSVPATPTSAVAAYNPRYKKKKRKCSSAGTSRGVKRQDENESEDGRAKSKNSPTINCISARKSQPHNPPWSPPRKLENIKSQMERDEERLRTQVQEFVDSLPANKPAITTWRPSVGHVPSQQRSSARTMEQMSDAPEARTTPTPQEAGDDTADGITWSRFQLSDRGASHIMSDIYLATDNNSDVIKDATDANKPPATATAAEVTNSFADLINCRYLRIPPSVQKAWE